MNLLNKTGYWKKLAGETTLQCVVFDILNSLSTRLHWKSRRAFSVSFRSRPNAPFYMRLGTTDWSTFRVTFLYDEYGFVRQHLPTVRTIIDLGANIGDSVRYFADTYPEAEILAVEPDAGNYAVCQKNAAMMVPSERVRCKQCFVSSHPGYAGIDRSKGEWEFRMDQTVSAAEQIPVVTIGELLREFKIAEVDLLKCDIEGEEVELFRRCSDWIFRIRHLAIETSPPYSVSALEKDLERNGAKFKKLHHSAPDGYHELALFSRCGEG